MAAKSLSYTVHSVLLKDAVSMEEITLPKSMFPVFVWLSLEMDLMEMFFESMFLFSLPCTWLIVDGNAHTKICILIRGQWKFS